MFPYFELGPWQLGPVRVYPFGAAVACALLTWLLLILRRAAPTGLDPRTALRLFESILVAGFIGALLFGQFHGYSSFGGAFGALAGALLYMRFRSMAPLDRRRYLDLLAFAFPFGWTFLRLGCTLVHDHPGRLTGSWLGVRYPGGNRYDLGLIEMLLSVAISCTFIISDRRKRPPGYYIQWIVICGPVRIVLDLLRDSPGVDIVNGFVLTVMGLWIWKRIHRIVT